MYYSSLAINVSEAVSEMYFFLYKSLSTYYTNFLEVTFVL